MLEQKLSKIKRKASLFAALSLSTLLNSYPITNNIKISLFTGYYNVYETTTYPVAITSNPEGANVRWQQLLASSEDIEVTGYKDLGTTPTEIDLECSKLYIGRFPGILYPQGKIIVEKDNMKKEVQFDFAKYCSKKDNSYECSVNVDLEN